MEMKKESNILTEEKPKYIISLKKRYRILYIVMFALFLVCTMYFGVISLCAGTDTMIFGIGITVIFFIFLFCFLYGLTRKCERYKGKVVYSYFLTKREYKLSDIVFSNEKTEEFYKDYGVGMFGLNKAFRIVENNGKPDFVPINNLDKVVLDDLTGYEIQKKKLVDNTEAFVQGKVANNCLLYGDAGTGKSTSIKAILNQYYGDGLRMIEIYKHQFKYLSAIISHIKNRNYRFIIYMDDLSFEEFEIEYKYLKAVIEGGMETKPDNVLIYATSNRRHLIRETWSDRSDKDEELHRSDTVQEKLSLAARFGVSINYSKPTQQEYFQIVTNLAKKYPEITMSDKELCAEANKWELSHGGISGRTAQQFINYIAGKADK